MGVPKFYRWISERYPCLSETVKEYQIPEFDNLYLDMNGIIHVCSHPNDDDPHFRISEEQIFKDIFHYIEVLFRMIQPREVFFMAVDGVAPRAKMNQQRGRRFRSAREAEENEKKALAKGEVLPKEARFDSNCITPGTEFMASLDEQLQYFVTSKMSNDALWNKCKVIYSGHKTPGEGEHKIMEFIRYAKCQPGYNLHTRHCLYGLDADLMMLGLTSHEPHFSLLREEVRFDKKYPTKRTPTPEETTFHLLHLSLMRQYINFEFSKLHDVSFGYDLESVIDDWVLMGFLVGNDFIPHLPTMHINRDALPILYQNYIEVLPTLDGYLNEGGYLNLKRFEKFMEKLTEYDENKFSEENEGIKYLMGKRIEAKERADRLEKFDFEDTNHENQFEVLEEGGLSNAEVEDTLARLGIEPSPLSDSEDMDEEGTFEEEFRQHKRNYYITKMEYEEVGPEVLKDQAANYVRGIQWILHYYYNGLSSWSWYYPFHYAPYISDIKTFSDVDMSFDIGSPFLPFQQLLAVLPPNSAKLLPEAYHKLLLDDSSPITDFYPKEFKTDLNGKQQDWEAVVLIPFIDEEKLLSEMSYCNKNLTPEEKSRHSHGPMYIYNFTLENLGEYKAPEYFPPISINRASTTLTWRDEWVIDPSKYIKGLLPGASTDVFFAGFPTLKHIDHTFRVAKESVKVFQSLSRGENYILEITKKELPSLPELANYCLGKAAFVNWPHLIEAKLTALTDGNVRLHFNDDNTISSNSEESYLRNIFNTQKRDLSARLHTRWGIDTEGITILAYAKTLSGRKYVPTADGNLLLEKEWSHIEQPFPFQMIVFDLPTLVSTQKQCIELHEFYAPGSKVFMLGHPYYGSMGEVMVSDSDTKGRVRVTMIAPHEPNLEPVTYYHRNNAQRYMTSHEAASRLGISAHLFARISGTILLAPALEKGPFQEIENSNSGNKLNIGLNLKSNKRNEEVMGFTRKCPERNTWLYSEKCLDAVKEYHETFPQVFNYLHSSNKSMDNYFQDQIFPQDYKEKVPELTKWIKASAFYSAERCSCGSIFLESNVVTKISEEVEKVHNLRAKCIRMQVKPHLLFKPNPYQGSSPPDKSVIYELFDRVINVRQGFSVPLGARGTVTGIQPSEKEIHSFYDVLFDEPFTGGLTLSGPDSAQRCYRLHWASLINISHGDRQCSMPSYKGNMNSSQHLNQKSTTPPSYPSSFQKQSPINNSGPSAFHTRFQPTGSKDVKCPQYGIYSRNNHDQFAAQSNSSPLGQRFPNELPKSHSQGQNLSARASPLEQQHSTSSQNALITQTHRESSSSTLPSNLSPTTTATSNVSSSSPLPPDPALLPSPIFKSNQPQQHTTPKKNQSQAIEIHSEDDVPFILHGNFFHNWQAIQAKGLRRDEKRDFIPCVSYIPRTIGPRSYQLHIYLDVGKLLKDNIRLLRLSGNQVLCSTLAQGFLPPYYFKKVVDTQSGIVIFPHATSIPLLPAPPLNANVTDSKNISRGSPNIGNDWRERGQHLIPHDSPQHAIRLHQNIWTQIRTERMVMSNHQKQDVKDPSMASQIPDDRPQNLPTGATSTHNHDEALQNPVALKDIIGSLPLQDSYASSRFVPIQVIRKQTSKKTSSEEPLQRSSETFSPTPPHLDETKATTPAKLAENKQAKPKKATKNRLAVNFEALKHSDY